MKNIDRKKVRQFRIEWAKKAEMWEAEAQRRREKAKTDSAKYRTTHLKMAEEAEAEARKWRNKLRELEDTVRRKQKEEV